jgi:hypothetical protein
LTLSNPYSPRLITGRKSRFALAVEKPPLASHDHCIGVRTLSRSGSVKSSPMPISSPCRIIGVPGKLSITA